jgi:hypothetical protein
VEGLWVAPGASGSNATRLTAATFPTTTDPNESSLDETCDFASSSFRPFELLDKEDDFSDEHSCFAWTCDFEEGGTSAGWLGRCVYGGDADDVAPDETRSLLGGLWLPRHHCRAKKSPPPLPRRLVCIRHRQFRAITKRRRQNPGFCPLWPLVLHRRVPRSGRTKARLHP